LTGENDRQTKTKAFNTTETKYQLFGTDLGSSFEHDGVCWFLFGDTHPSPNYNPPKDHDSVASTLTINPEPGIALSFRALGNQYIPPVLLDTDGTTTLDVGSLDVPVAGFSADGRMFIFYSTDAAKVIETAGDGGLDVFYTGSDNFYTGYNGVGTNWANPEIDHGNWSLPAGIAATSQVRQNAPLAAITRLAGAADVFWIGPDGAVATTWTNPQIDSGAWHPSFPITPPGAAGPNSPIAAVTRLNGALDVFYIGGDGAVATAWANPQIDNGAWHAPFPITPPGATRPNSPIAAVTRLNGALDVFYIGGDGAVATTWANPQIDNGAWHAPFPITPPGAARPNSPIAAVTRLNGALDVFYIGGDGAVATTWANPQIDNGAWHSPFPITPPGAAGPNSPIAAVTRFIGALDVFYIGGDGTAATTWANPQIDNAAWHAPFPITPPGAAGPNSPIAAVTRFNGALDVFYIGGDGAAATTWANPQIDNAAWHHPFPITLPGWTAARPGLAAITRANGMTAGPMGRTVLARAIDNDPTNLHVIYEMSSLPKGGRFINISCAVMPNGLSGLPFQGPALLAWGSGRYRRSNVCFACIPLNEATDDNTTQASWWYFAGENASLNQPLWSHDQQQAAEVFPDFLRQVGELSVSWIEPLGVWLMLYNAPYPRGILARVATLPWGPWSDPPIVLFNPSWPGLGYGAFMHEGGSDDGLSDPGREAEWGGEYGPYVIGRYTKAGAAQKQAVVYFTMSTWNPYEVMLMTASIQLTAD
jgi:hypothetical protein